jgi:hypothetical protein
VRLVVDYFASRARRRLLRLRRASRCLGTSRGSSRGLSCDSSSTTSPRAGLSSTTSPTPRVRVPRHVVRLVTRLVVDYLTSRRLVVDYFAYAALPSASAHRAARHAARRRLLHLHRASGCFGMSRDLSHNSSSTTSPRAGSSSTTLATPCVWVPRHVVWLIMRLIVDYFASRRLVVDYFAYVACPGASARPAARHAASRRLLRLRRASRCLGTSRGSSRDSSRCSSSTTSPTPRVRVPWHVTWLISPLVVDYFASAARPGASTRRATHHAARRRLLRAPRLPLAAILALLQPHRVSRLLVLRQHWLYFKYAARRRDVVFQSLRIDHSSRLVWKN